MHGHRSAALRLKRRRALVLASLVALALTACAKKELHRRQGSVLVTGDGWGEIAPCG